MRKCSKCKDHDIKCQASQITKPLRCAASLSCALQAGILGFARYLAQCHACKIAKDIALDNYGELKYGQLVTEWRMKWQPTPVFLPGESQGRGSLVGCRLWGRTESDTTEAT